jgi:ankyrin repeat protein
MLDHGAGPNTPFGAHPRAPTRTLYQEAVARGHVEMAELLARYGAQRDPPALDTSERFVQACLRMDGRRVREMIERHRELLTDPRAIQRAIELDRDDAVRMLLDLGMSPDLEDPAHGGHRPLHAAGAHGAVKCARLLIARGADVDARESTYQGSPLTWAAHFGHRQMIELLGQYARDVWHLTYTGRVERLREVLDEEPHRAHAVSTDGWTPLMWLPDDEVAASEIVRLFLRHGAAAAQRNSDGESAADIAERRGMTEVARLLRGSF